jgi:hypothetical protein
MIELNYGGLREDIFFILSEQLPKTIGEKAAKLAVEFDQACQSNGLEKIKTIGDAYMVFARPNRRGSLEGRMDGSTG